MNVVRTIAAVVFALAFLWQPARSSALVSASPESRVGAILGGTIGGLHQSTDEANDGVALGDHLARGGDDRWTAAERVAVVGVLQSLLQDGVALIDDTGAVVERVSDDPYRATTIVSAHRATTIVNAHRDPLGYIDAFDPWLYVAGDPFNLMDPMGLESGQGTRGPGEDPDPEAPEDPAQENGVVGGTPGGQGASWRV